MAAPAAALALQAGGEALNAVGTLADGLFSRWSYRQRAAALRNQASRRRLEGEAEANDRARAGRQAVGRGLAVAGASGFTAQGSAADVLAMMARDVSVSASRARYEAYRDAAVLDTQARMAYRAGNMGLIGSLLGSASQGAQAAATAGASGGGGG